MTELIKSVMEEVLKKHAEQTPEVQRPDDFFSVIDDDESFSPAIESTPSRSQTEKNVISDDKRKLNSILKKQGLEFKNNKVQIPGGGNKKNVYAQSTFDRVYNYLFDVDDRVTLPPQLKNAAKVIVNSWKNDTSFSQAAEKYPNLKQFSSLKWEHFD